MRFHNHFTSIEMVFLFAAFLASLPLALASPSAILSALFSPTSNAPIKPRSIDGSYESKSVAALEKRQMSEGSSCDGSEGQWNCLTDQWQRCAAGRWSVVVDCAEGTMCSPSGLTYDFSVQFANGAAGGPATSDSTPKSRVHQLLPEALLIFGVVVSLVTS